MYRVLPVPKHIPQHYPDEYKPASAAVTAVPRRARVHSWNTYSSGVTDFTDEFNFCHVTR